MADSVLVDTDDTGVALVTLNRPGVKNAMDQEMVTAFTETVWSLNDDDGVRVIVVTGAGDAYCSGIDLSDLTRRRGNPFGGDARQLPGSGEAAPDAVASLLGFWRMRTPVVAAVNGAAIGAGLTLALLTDIRYVAIDAKLRFPFTRLNLVPEANSTWLVPRLVGPSRALELMLSGRFFSGEEAAAMGMASRALPAGEVLDAALDLAHEIAVYCAPVATGLTKQLVYRSLEEPDRVKACTVESRLASWTGSLPDTFPSLEAFKARRRPSFSGSKHETPPAEIDPMRALG